jgi:hypothetical protein
MPAEIGIYMGKKENQTNQENTSQKKGGFEFC